jgi:diguanylate cyclase (GGDEF)-like protein
MILISDTFTWILDGTTEPYSRPVLILSATIYYLLHPFICLVLLLYVDLQVNHDNSRLKRSIRIMLTPFIIYSAFSILSSFGNFFFYYDSKNVYHRGRFFILVPIFSFLFIAYTTLYVLKNRKRIHKKFFLSFLIFSVPPIIGSIIQMAVYGIVLIWTGMTISILIIFINIQNEQMNMDYLTGLFNRRQLDFYLKELIRKNKAKIAGIMLDINSFKNINDQYGHFTGDEALKYTSRLLKETFGNRAFLSRFGGDEFVVLFEVNDKADLEQALGELKANVVKFNALKELPYDIDFSIGADLYPGKAAMNEQEFINYIDSLMYQDKQTLLHQNVKSS